VFDNQRDHNGENWGVREDMMGFLNSFWSSDSWKEHSVLKRDHCAMIAFSYSPRLALRRKDRDGHQCSCICKQLEHAIITPWPGCSRPSKVVLYKTQHLTAVICQIMYHVSPTLIAYLNSHFLKLPMDVGNNFCISPGLYSSCQKVKTQTFTEQTQLHLNIVIVKSLSRKKNQKKKSHKKLLLCICIFNVWFSV
jgi:hypothetical protein